MESPQASLRERQGQVELGRECTPKTRGTIPSPALRDETMSSATPCKCDPGQIGKRRVAAPNLGR